MPVGLAPGSAETSAVRLQSGYAVSTKHAFAAMRSPTIGTAKRILFYTGGSIPLAKFDAKPKHVRSTRGPRSGVTVKVRKDEGRKLDMAIVCWSDDLWWSGDR